LHPAIGRFGYNCNKGKHRFREIRKAAGRVRGANLSPPIEIDPILAKLRPGTAITARTKPSPLL
jgi:hypothetical protein